MKKILATLTLALCLASVSSQPAEAGVLKRVWIVAKLPFRLAKNVAVMAAMGAAYAYTEILSELDNDIDLERNK